MSLITGKKSPIYDDTVIGRFLRTVIVMVLRWFSIAFLRFLVDGQ